MFRHRLRSTRIKDAQANALRKTSEDPAQLIRHDRGLTNKQSLINNERQASVVPVSRKVHDRRPIAIRGGDLLASNCVNRGGYVEAFSVIGATELALN